MTAKRPDDQSGLSASQKEVNHEKEKHQTKSHPGKVLQQDLTIILNLVKFPYYHSTEMPFLRP